MCAINKIFMLLVNYSILVKGAPRDYTIKPK